jgi:glycosyltransferase involved in cell wall biosynthesis
MKATIISTFDIAGGAALAGYEIAKALNLKTDIQTRILCSAKYSHDANIMAIYHNRYKWIDKLFSTLIIRPTIGQNYWLPVSYRMQKHEYIEDANLVNLHNIHGDYIAYSGIRALSRKVPLLITMHDMWYLTGHCAYARDCNGWLRGCSPCPNLEAYPKIKHDTAAFHWKKKKELYTNANISFMASSHWLQNLARKSPLLDGKEVTCIYNPYNTEVLKPRDKRLVRKLLEIPENKKIVAFGAATIHDPRKGLLTFLKKINQKFVKDNNLFLLIMGKGPQSFLKQIPDWLPFRYFGPVPSEEFRSFIYNAADLFIFPTKAENLSNMLIESLASGTPCVTFDVGGCGEVIHTSRTGYLARPGDFNDFLYGIELIVNDSALQQQMSKSARQLVMSDFTYEACAKNYEKLLRRIGNK